MPDYPTNIIERLKGHLIKALQVVLVFVAVFIAMSLFEFQSYQHDSHQLASDMPRISNLHSNINATNLNHYQGRTLILYNSRCKACQATIPKYYGTDSLIDRFTFHAQPIYLDIQHGDNQAIFNQLSISTTPKQTRINNINYNKDNGQINNISQEQADIHVPRLVGMLFFVNVFWTSLFTLVYVLIGNVIQRQRDKEHMINKK